MLRFRSQQRSAHGFSGARVTMIAISWDWLSRRAPLLAEMIKAHQSRDLMVSKGKAPPKVLMRNLGRFEPGRSQKGWRRFNTGQNHPAGKQQLQKDIVISQDTTSGVLIEQVEYRQSGRERWYQEDRKTETLEFTLPTKEGTISQKSGSVTLRVPVRCKQTHRAGTNVSVTVSYYGSGSAEVRLNSDRFKVFPTWSKQPRQPNPQEGVDAPSTG